MAQQSIRKNERVAAFAALAEQYCSLIDSREDFSKKEFIRRVAVLLGELFAAGVGLMDVGVEHQETDGKNRTTVDEWQTLFTSLRKKLGKEDEYLGVLDPYSDEAPTPSSLSDDLADIYGDLKKGLDAYGRTERDSLESVWVWVLHFQIHWGYHCSGAMHAIHRLFFNEYAED